MHPHLVRIMRSSMRAKGPDTGRENRAHVLGLTRQLGGRAIALFAYHEQLANNLVGYARGLLLLTMIFSPRGKKTRLLPSVTMSFPLLL